MHLKRNCNALLRSILGVAFFDVHRSQGRKGANLFGDASGGIKTPSPNIHPTLTPQDVDVERTFRTEE